MMWRLAFAGTTNNKDRYDFYLLQHLQSAYPDICKLIEETTLIKNKTDILKVNFSEAYQRRKNKEHDPKDEENIDLFVIRMQDLMDDVENGFCLKGECDRCCREK